METDNNLKEAFAGESRANRKYTAFSERAEEEGFRNVAKLLKAASEAEAIHSARLLRVMKEVSSTAGNLEKGIEGETYEFTRMYPGFIEKAKSEGNNDAVTAFTYAMKAEEVHAKFYRQALERVKAGRDLDAQKFFLCPVCGNIALDAPPERCPICGVPGSRFRKIE
ncbi:MAG: rubrerythrin family protein [Methanomicrobiales archaeon]|nr:rubrerythrin family protein [Methanomicrobiales archaeon]